MTKDLFLALITHIVPVKDASFTPIVPTQHTRNNATTANRMTVSFVVWMDFVKDLN